MDDKRLTCEVGGDPAVDLLGTELSVGDDYGEDDEHGHGVLVVTTERMSMARLGLRVWCVVGWVGAEAGGLK